MKRAMVCAALMLFLWGFTLGALLTRPAVPYCPQEDSCKVDYHDGAWTVIPLQPWEI